MTLQRTQLPTPPNPNSSQYSSNIQQWVTDAYTWMSQVQQRLQQDSTVNTAPIGSFQVVSYTATSTMTGTDALSNTVATLISKMQQGGYLT